MVVYSAKVNHLTGGIAVADSRMMQTMLLDFYGELLTEKQRQCYDLHYNEDLSLAEIAEQSGISRQAVWDNIRRAEAALQDIEEKTGLIRRFQETRRTLDELSVLTDRLTALIQGEAKDIACRVAQGIEELRTKG